MRECMRSRLHRVCALACTLDKMHRKYDHVRGHTTACALGIYTYIHLCIYVYTFVYICVYICMCSQDRALDRTLDKMHRKCAACKKGWTLCAPRVHMI